MKLPTWSIVGCALLISAQAVVAEDYVIGHAFSNPGCSGAKTDIKVSGSTQVRLGYTAKSVFVDEKVALFSSGDCSGTGSASKVNSCTTFNTGCLEVGNDG